MGGGSQTCGQIQAPVVKLTAVARGKNAGINVDGRIATGEIDSKGECESKGMKLSVSAGLMLLNA